MELVDYKKKMILIWEGVGQYILVSDVLEKGRVINKIHCNTYEIFRKKENKLEKMKKKHKTVFHKKIFLCLCVMWFPMYVHECGCPYEGQGLMPNI